MKYFKSNMKDVMKILFERTFCVWVKVIILSLIAQFMFPVELSRFTIMQNRSKKCHMLSCVVVSDRIFGVRDVIISTGQRDKKGRAVRMVIANISNYAEVYDTVSQLQGSVLVDAMEPRNF